MLDDPTCTEYKTRPMVAMLNALGVDSRAPDRHAGGQSLRREELRKPAPRVETSLATNLECL